MWKEKINQFFQKDGDSKKKIENLVFLLIILTITILAINYIWNNDQSNAKENKNTMNKQLAQTVQEENGNEEKLEIKLQNILSQINGVGEVSVLLTYNESTQVVPIYNKTEKTTNTTEGDSSGGTRKIEESDVSQEVVYQNNDTKGTIATQKTISPKIEGAIITATGATNSNIKTSIIQAVEAATGLATHKIQVFEKQK